MARPLRLIVPGGWYHVVNRGQRRERIFLDDEDRRAFLRGVAELPERFQVEVHAFVLMENHYHLLLRPKAGNLSRAIQWLQLSYASRFNWAHRMSGHLFQGRFKSVLIQDSSKVAEVARYLHLNPVRIAGLGLTKADQQRAKVAGLPDPGAELVARRLQLLKSHFWSSWPVYAGQERPPEWLDTSFVWRANGGRSRREWMEAIREYTEEPIRQGNMESPWNGVVGGVVLGEAAYAQELLGKAKAVPEEQTEARKLGRTGRMLWKELVSMAEAARGVKWEDLLERYGDWTRDAVLYLAVRHGSYGLSEVYREIPGLKYQAAAQGVKRIVERRKSDPECEAFLRRLSRQMSKI